MSLFVELAVAADAASHQAAGIAVIYPDIGEPYRAVFTKMIEGVEEQARGTVPRFAIGANRNSLTIAEELRRRDIRVVIALGRKGLNVSSTLDKTIGVVAGGVLSIPEAEVRDMSVLSFAPDPALLFARLQSFAPGIRRVFAVYDPNQNAWLMRLAKEAAKARAIELVAYEAADLRTALRIYQSILAQADPGRDALWLPQDSATVDDTSVLPLVLKETWERNLVLFSSSAAHVRRGALFSLYPDNTEIGRHLASAALGYVSSGHHVAIGLRPLRALRVAVNLRTASHLGISLGDRQIYDLVFPEQ
jgi:putative ABC transport system substrate-binding protein